MRSWAMLTTLVLATFSGCGESSDDPADTGTSIDGAVTATDGAITTSDAATTDAASGDPLANLPGDYVFRYAHMHAAGTNMPSFPERVDVCLTRQGTGTTTRVYEGTSGIGRFEVGAWRLLPTGRYDAKVIAAADTCAGTAVYTVQVDQLATAMYKRTTLAQITSLAGQTANIYGDTLLPASFTNQDVVTFLNTIVGAPAQELRFMDGAGMLTARDSNDLQLAPGRSGTLTMTFAGLDPPANVTRAYRSARGRLMAFGHGNGPDKTVGLTICDDLAPPDGHLSHCTTTVRAP